MVDGRTGDGGAVVLSLGDEGVKVLCFSWLSYWSLVDEERQHWLWVSSLGIADSSDQVTGSNIGGNVAAHLYGEGGGRGGAWLVGWPSS